MIRSRRTFAWVLAAACVLAALLRLPLLGAIPPGIHVDAASDAWSAACLRAVGTDASGKAWPVLSTAGFGDQRSALSLYPLAAVQSIVGVSAWSTALPSALAGILAVLLLGLVGAALFDRTTGLCAAAILAVVPWSLWLGRTGHQAGLVPLLALLPAAALAASGLPLGDRPVRAGTAGAALAGLLAGASLYGYAALRAFVPVFLLACLAANLREWRRLPRRALLAFAGAFLLAALPLAWAYCSDPAMGARARELAPWTPDSSWTERLGLLLGRYGLHFGPGFLFAQGDGWILHRLPGGPLPWSLVAPLLAGVVLAVRGFESSASRRLALAAALAYPIADVASRHPFGGHLLRSAPGLPWLALLAAFGAVSGLRLLGRHTPTAAKLTAVLLAVGLAGETGRSLLRAPAWSRGADIWDASNADLLQAGSWLRPRLQGAEAVFLTGRSVANSGQNWVVWLVSLGGEPEEWVQEAPRTQTIEGRTLVVGWGKVRLLMDEGAALALRELDRNGRPDRVLLALRPEDSSFRNPDHVIRAPDGRAVLLLFDRVR